MIKFYILKFGLALMLIVAVGCTPISPNFAQRKAQPKVPAARNFTSFSASLRCMDGLLKSSRRGVTYVSSTGIPDLTKKISVGADEMLVNAINQMNKTSKKYVFLDQSLEREVGQISIYTPVSSERKPTLYIRGAISQLDQSVSSSNLSVDLDNTTNSDAGDAGLSRGLSIVTVDMHLVSFPDKTIVPGASSANSMVVTNRGYGLGGSGVINVTAFDATLAITRVESLGQAVRNLVELGAIELIGRHAGVPYWECLNIPAVNQRKTNAKEIVFSSSEKYARIPEVQSMLRTLGYFSGDQTGILDPRTRDALSHFQAKNNLIATGNLNYDTYQQLREQTRGFAPRRKISEFEEGETTRPNAKVIVVEKPAPFSTKTKGSLTLKANKSRYRVGDNFVVTIRAPRGGFMSCFHQTNTAPIVQVLPSEPNRNLQVGMGQPITIPSQFDNFDIKFEARGQIEKLLCILELGKTPRDYRPIAAKTALAPMKLQSFQEIIQFYADRGNPIMWGEIQKKVIF